MQEHTHKTYPGVNMGYGNNGSTLLGYGSTTLEPTTINSGRSGNETRPTNLTIKIWKRIN